jgi:hypothetical protein
MSAAPAILIACTIVGAYYGVMRCYRVVSTSAFHYRNPFLHILSSTFIGFAAGLLLSELAAPLLES